MINQTLKSAAPFYVVDGGCRNGFKELRGLGAFTHYLGFDPAQDACVNDPVFLSQSHVRQGLYHSPGSFDFYECGHSSMSSMLEFDEAQFLAHFGLMDNSGEWLQQLRVARKSSIECCTLASTMDEKGWKEIDYLKLDTQGTELAVLRGAEPLLAAGKIKVIRCEVAFVPVYKEQALFHEIAGYLESFGYRLADLSVYPDAAYQSGKSALALDGFKEKIRIGSGGDAVFYLAKSLGKKENTRQGVVLAGLQVFSLANQILHKAGMGEKEIAALFRYLQQQHSPPGSKWKRLKLKARKLKRLLYGE